jgi:hypothetical protein
LDEVVFILLLSYIILRADIPSFFTSKVTNILLLQPRNAQDHKIGKPNNFKVFVSNKTKGHKQDSQNRLRSYKPEGGEP